jgi:hypothetical protein
MRPAKVDTDTFIRLYEELGLNGLSRRLGQAAPSVAERRRRIEKRIGRTIHGPERGPTAGGIRRPNINHDHRAVVEVWDGHAVIGSDAHYWPNIVTTAHRAFVHFVAKFQPKCVILNGDVFDGASISRHPSIGWESKPSVIQEIEACKERLDEIEKAAKNAKLVWTLGNHDARFETSLANRAPEYAKVHGVHLKDHFPYWTPAWSCWLNNDVVVKHRLKGGIHATHNNTVGSGRSTVTGHLHSLKVTPYTDYNGTRYGIDCGTLAGGATAPQFVNYLEDAPANWRSGFVLLTFKNGKLLVPEVVQVSEQDPDAVEFRGELVHV